MKSMRVSGIREVATGGAFKLCSNFLAHEKSSAAQVLGVLNTQPESQLIFKQLAVSQNTSLERSDNQFVELIQQASLSQTSQAPVDNGTNCCTCLGLGIF